MSCYLHAYSLTDAAIQQVNWDASKVKDKLKRDIEGHVASVRATKLSEVCAKYEVGPSLDSFVYVMVQHRESFSNLRYVVSGTTYQSSGRTC